MCSEALIFPILYFLKDLSHSAMDDTGWQVKTLNTKFVLKYKICTKMYYKYMLQSKNHLTA